MESLGDIYKYLNLRLNKAQLSGIISPDDMTFALKAVSARMFNVLRGLYEETRSISDDIRPVVKTLGGPDNSPLVFDVNGYADLPEDYETYVSSSYLKITGTDCDGKPVKKWVPIEMLNSNEFDHRMNSSVVNPDLEYPMGVVENNRFRVEPRIKLARFVYLSKPDAPFFDYIITNNEIIYLAPGEVHDGTVLTAGTASRSVEPSWVNYQALAELLYRVFSVQKRAQLPLNDAVNMEQENIAQWLNKP